jgi:hypothetical protein
MDRPRPLRTDGSNEFARYSMQARVPRIALDTLERNPDFSLAVRRAVERLAADIEANRPIPAPRAPAPDVAAWGAAHAEHAGETWLGAEWFYAELAFYREMVHACRFWETGRDPFAPAKDEELAQARLWQRLETALGRAGSREERIAALLDDCLWGNRVDLSYAVAAARDRPRDEDLLVDDRAAAVPRLASPGACVHVVADNAGTELALDLALVGALLEDPGARVTLHLKMQPTFVSDAMPCDLWRLVARMRDRGGAPRALADAVRAAFDAERLTLAADPFWTGPRFLWQAPAHLEEALASATIVVLKGDANYRRVVGDALWPPETPFAQACSYLRAPLLALRTMKSDPVLGLPPGLAARLDAEDPRWRIDGRRGVAQLGVPAPSASRTGEQVLPRVMGDSPSRTEPPRETTRTAGRGDAREDLC